jgi:hypothetical protein
LRHDYGFSERHACELLEIPRSSFRYRSRREDGPLRARLQALAQQYPRFGYRIGEERGHVNRAREAFRPAKFPILLGNIVRGRLQEPDKQPNPDRDCEYKKDDYCDAADGHRGEMLFPLLPRGGNVPLRCPRHSPWRRCSRV